MQHRSRSRFWLVLALCAAATPAAAQFAPDPRAEAKQHFDRGVLLFQDEQYEASAVEFRRAYELSPHFEVLYNLGMAYAAFGKPVEAADTLQQYLDDGAAKVPTDKRTAALDELARQKQRIARLTIRVSTDGAVVEVDDVKVGTSPLREPVRVGVGRRRITVRGQGFRPVTREESVAGEEHRSIEITLEVEGPAPPPVDDPAKRDAATATAPSLEGPGAWPWVVVGVSGAMMAGGGVLLALAQSDVSTVEGAEKGTRWSELEGAYDGAPVKSTAGVVLLGVGAAGLVAGVLWALAEDDSDAAVNVTRQRDRLTLGGRF
jgi:hypothetical protein